MCKNRRYPTVNKQNFFKKSISLSVFFVENKHEQSQTPLNGRRGRRALFVPAINERGAATVAAHPFDNLLKFKHLFEIKTIW